MKNLKAFALLFLAVLIGLAAAVYAANMASKQTLVSNKVVVAAVDIDLGGRITPQMLTTMDWPAGAVPAGAFSDIQVLQDRVVKVGVMKGEAVVERKLAPPGSKGGLSAVIAEGKRAMTVRVNDVVGVAGFALPGNYVDVMVNAQQDKGRDGRDDNRQISKTVLEHVLVLAVAQEANRDDTKPRVVSAVTLELSPEDSEKLDLARSVGTLSLVLRNQVDKESVATQGITKSQLFDSRSSKSASAANVLPVKSASTSTASRPRQQAAADSGTPVKRSPVCVEVIQNGSQALNCF